MFLRAAVGTASQSPASLLPLSGEGASVSASPHLHALPDPLRGRRPGRKWQELALRV